MRQIAIIVGLLFSAAAYGQPEATIEVNAGRVLHAIPRTIYGTFLEPIGNSIYGGLWAQILTNPSFEDNLWSAGRAGHGRGAAPALPGPQPVRGGA